MFHLRPVLVAACMLVSIMGSSVASGRQSADAAPSFTDGELDQLLASIALYPDSLLSQVFMASTYPLEVVQADRWVKRNPSMVGDALAKALENETWDASVKSLVNFPDVIEMMSENLDWTTRLGDAFISQQVDVMRAVQRLRASAKAAGHLEDNEQQTVEVEQSGDVQVIVIESRSPSVVYVPVYNPTVVYGVWRYPAYPPHVYYPPGYVATSSVIAFGAGVALGAAWGYAWGNCNWRRGDININVNKNTNFNTNINRNEARINVQNRSDGRGTWQHDGAHRRGVSYRDQATSQRFGQGSTRDAARARENYRGRAEAGARDLSRGAARPTPSPDRTGRLGADATRDRSGRGQQGGGILGGADRSGKATRQASDRGRTSRGGSAGGGGRARPSRGGIGGGGRGGGRRR